MVELTSVTAPRMFAGGPWPIEPLYMTDLPHSTNAEHGLLSLGAGLLPSRPCPLRYSWSQLLRLWDECERTGKGADIEEYPDDDLSR